MRGVRAVLRAALLWSFPLLVTVLLWGPLSALASGGPVQLVLVLTFAAVVIGSFARASLDLTLESLKDHRG